MISRTHTHYVQSKAATDEELVKLFLDSRDKFYFQELYERYSLKVFQKCLAVTRDSSRAEDLTHDVFLKLIFKINQFKKDAKFSTWLFSITYNHCMDLVRNSRRTTMMVYIDNIELEDDKDLFRIFDLDGLDKTSLNIALDQMHKEEKIMLYLKYLDDRSIRDIACLFKITESAVKMRLMRSREKLRKKYSESLLHR